MNPLMMWVGKPLQQCCMIQGKIQCLDLLLHTLDGDAEILASKKSHNF